MSRKSTEILDEADLVAFNHVAAGHEGVKSNSDGSLIIKPCTQQEVAFYESAANHPDLRAFMPTFMGTLAQGSPPTASLVDGDLVLSPLNTALATNTIFPNSLDSQNLRSATSSTTPGVLFPILSQGSELTRNTCLSPNSTNISAQATPWIPNPNPFAHHGRALTTDVSIVLENVADGFVHPNILDVKLGSRLWADDAPPAKRAKFDEISKSTTSASLGFRIAGMKVWKGSSEETKAPETQDPKHKAQNQGDWEDKDNYRCYDKFYGRKLTVKNAKTGFEEFLSGLKKEESRKLLAARLVHELRCIQHVLEKKESRMYSASVLIVYEGDEEAFEKAIEAELIMNARKEVEYGSGAIDADEEDDAEDIPKVNDVRLIDFAHAEWTPGLGPDENMLQGIRNTLSILEDLANP